MWKANWWSNCWLEVVKDHEALLKLLVVGKGLRQKRQKRQAHSTTLARGPHTPRYGRSFWSAPVFSGAFPQRDSVPDIFVVSPDEAVVVTHRLAAYTAT